MFVKHSGGFVFLQKLGFLIRKPIILFVLLGIPCIIQKKAKKPIIQNYELLDGLRIANAWLHGCMVAWSKELLKEY